MSSRQLRKQRRAAARAIAKAAAQEAAAAEQARRAEINRENAQHSTGPKTQAGKAASSRNAFKHGLYSRQLCLPTEDPAALDALKADLRAEHQPINQTEEILVNEIAEQYWRLCRARRFETLVFDGEALLSHLAAVQRMMSSAERGFYKALSALRQLQQDRGKDPATLAQPASDSLPQDAEPAASEPPAAAAASAPESQAGFVSQNDPDAATELPEITWEEEDPPANPPYLPNVAAALERILSARDARAGFVSQNRADLLPGYLASAQK